MASLATKEILIQMSSDGGAPALSRKFVMSPLSIWVSNGLQKNLLALFGPALAGIEGGLSFKSEFNVGKAAEAVSKVLGELDDEKYQALFTKLLSTTVWLPEGPDAMTLPTGAQPLSLSNPTNLDIAFERDLEAMFKLCIAVMEYNRFPFFARLVRAGQGMLATVTSSAGTRNGKKPPKQ